MPADRRDRGPRSLCRGLIDRRACARWHDRLLVCLAPDAPAGALFVFGRSFEGGPTWRGLAVVNPDMKSFDACEDGAANADVMGWGSSPPHVLAAVLNTALAAEDLDGFAALLSDMARDRGFKGARGSHQSIYDMPYASLLPRQQHLLADAFELLIRLGLELQPRRPRVLGDIQGGLLAHGNHEIPAD